MIILAASHVGSQLTSHISLSVSLCEFPVAPQRGPGRLDSAMILLIVCARTGIMVVVTTKLHKAIPMVGANACAALKHTLLVVGFYFIRSLLAMWCPTNFAARTLKIRHVPV